MRQVGLQLARGGTEHIFGRKGAILKGLDMPPRNKRDDDDNDDDDIEGDNDVDGHDDADGDDDDDGILHNQTRWCF